MRSFGYGPFTPKGHFLESSTLQEKHDSSNIGHIRVSFQYDRCADATILAQQIREEKSNLMTFRPWDPTKKQKMEILEAKEGNFDDEEDEPTCCYSCFCCYICMCVSGCFKLIGEEVIDHAADGMKTAPQYFIDQEKILSFTTDFIRFLGVGMCIGGFYLLFTPLILLLKWIPLLGAFLGGAAAVAAFLFALVVGLTLSLINIAIAWVLFRPIVALSLLAIASIGIYFILIWEGPEIEDTK